MTIQDRKQRENEARRRAILSASRLIAETEGWNALTTRRLAHEIEYSQPVIYAHFDGRDAIIEAIALEGFDELATVLNSAHLTTADPRQALLALASAYSDFADRSPALYEAMFVARSTLSFANAATPDVMKAAFQEIVSAVRPFAAGRPPGVLAEVVWAALHGVCTLKRGSRLGPEPQSQRLEIIVGLVAG
jgi:AcrR family transcriptional regulator